MLFSIHPTTFNSHCTQFCFSNNGFHRPLLHSSFAIKGHAPLFSPLGSSLSTLMTGVDELQEVYQLYDHAFVTSRSSHSLGLVSCTFAKSSNPILKEMTEVLGTGKLSHFLLCSTTSARIFFSMGPSLSCVLDILSICPL